RGEGHQHAEAEHPRDGDGGRRLGPDAVVARCQGDESGGERDPGERAREQRRADQRRRHEAGEEAVSERLRAVAQAVAHHPEAERAGDGPEQDHLCERVPADARLERLEQRDGGDAHQWSWWWCWTASARTGSPPASITTISLP